MSLKGYKVFDSNLVIIKKYDLSLITFNQCIKTISVEALVEHYKYKSV